MKSSQFTNALWVLSMPLLSGAASASVLPRSGSVHISTEQIEAIAPTSSSCDSPPSPGECATAEQAAKNIAASFETYRVTSLAEQAAVIGLMAFESGDFKYNRNHYPGVPGQGTRNMQSPAFNAKYAASIPDIADKLAQVGSDPAGVLDILLNDEAYDFGSGAWFLTTQCTQHVRTQLQSGSEAGWAAYISSCVGTGANEARKAYWTRAVQALRAQGY
ncbi:uncharacterized protein ATNIH1004_009995 [Aspergillus tanneri]|uniref:Transglycosylase SLT domain-containing protein n=1 Tax=Aspergillus tanneri TaxID=1220188 RepID=A0A5M9ME28_9EURO|nr:uncharacterized protein ATNIH1004_009995 [Aspergillus tanneri]KAA8643233.1 hypothetical protein ATNIH1004_009995 [Aspergillus tanneri]